VAVTAAMDMYAGNQFHTRLPVTPRVTVAHGSINALSAERGASLAAFPRRAWERSMVLPPSRAGSLPQGIRCTPNSQVGFKAASLWLLIAGAPLTTMAERRHCAVGKPAGRRFSRAGPRMAHRGDPRSNAGVRACRALARHRVVGQSLLLPFWRLKKGVAVKAKP
jgi:hypothetical protein